MLPFLTSQESRMRRNAANWLELAAKVWDFRRDLLGDAEAAELAARRDDLQNRLRNRADAGSLKLGIEALEGILRRTGGSIYPKTSLGENVEFFLVAALVILAVRTYFVQPFKIPTNSMWPTYYGMTAENLPPGAAVPGKLAQAFRLLAFGAKRTVVTAPRAGEVSAQFFPSGYLACTVKSGRSWLVFPTQVREYTFLVDGAPAVVQVPFDFDEFDKVFRETYFGGDEGFYRFLEKQAHDGRMEGSWIRASDASADMVRALTIRLNRTVKAGDPILRFDLMTGDQLFVDRVSYHFTRPVVGQAFVFRTDHIPGIGKEDYYITRLVGVPGDVMEVRSPALYRNGRPITGGAGLRARGVADPPVHRLHLRGHAAQRHLPRKGQHAHGAPEFLFRDGRQFPPQRGRARLGVCAGEGRRRTAAFHLLPLHPPLGTGEMIAYIFTTFPKPTETFLQREVIALRAQGADLRLYSLWGGEASFRGMPVERFNKWRLLTLAWVIPLEAWRRPRVLGRLLRGLATRRPPSWINFWENMLGAGFACIYARSFRREPPEIIHAVWGGAPATAAWILAALDGHRYSAAAHAYDIYEHGGDWWLREKLGPAAFIHTSTEMARLALVQRGLRADRIACIRRGLDRLPEMKPLRHSRLPLRLICVARLVEKKGLDRQLHVYAALRAAGVPFSARIVGDGPLGPELERLAGRLGVAADVTFTGHLPNHEVWGQLLEADVLLHTGVIAPSGDRDGLPNVIPEAMSIGVLVLTSPTAGTTEAIEDGRNGLVAPVDAPELWVAALRRLSADDALAESLRTAARKWVEENFDARRNAGRLRERFAAALAAPPDNDLP